jgi:hypothetical protein
MLITRLQITLHFFFISLLDHACSGKNDRQGLVQVSAMFVLLLLTRERADQLHQPQPMLKAFAWFGSK